MRNLSADDAAGLKQALVTGSARSDAGRADGALLAKLALAAQRSRLVRRQPPALADGERLFPADARPVLGDAARALAIQLFAGPNSRVDDALALETARALKRSGLRLHPFDLSRLEAYVARHVDALGAFERAWLRLVRPAKDKAPYLDAPTAVNEDTFADASPAAKLAFLKQCRADDPARARRIIEVAAPNEPAQARAEMVALLATGLTSDDQPFLESLAGDRARTVKEVAESLLSRLPGHPAYAKRLGEAIAILEVKASGLLRRKQTIALKLGRELKPEQIEQFVAAALDGLRLGDLAAGLGMPIERFVEAAFDNATLARQLLAAAMEQHRLDLARQLSDALDEADDLTLFFTLARVLPTMASGDRAAAVRSLVRPQRWKTFPAAPWQHLHAGLEGPLPTQTAEDILRSSAWRAMIDGLAASDDKVAAEVIATVAALVPASLSSRFLAEIAPLPIPIKRRASAYHALLGALATATPVSPST